jgi:hypothetical protein
MKAGLGQVSKKRSSIVLGIFDQEKAQAAPRTRYCERVIQQCELARKMDYC